MNCAGSNRELHSSTKSWLPGTTTSISTIAPNELAWQLTAQSLTPPDLLAFLAGTTNQLGLATGVLALPNHHPVILAKRAATVDALSSSRL
ncbi:LLM class flavin-dependent oxidoreductase [Mycobacterium lepromatosis]|uniref:LLM class flavin-dependent oxidoreductase n=1 Tax=Mycobacterium lepromatosis TaxID=480418 RepID=UPI0031F36BF2